MKTSREENRALDLVLSYQSEVVDAERIVDELRVAIQNTNFALEKLNSFTTVLPSLVIQRENVLADIAMGMDKQAELNQLDTDICTEESRKREHEEAVAKACSTLKPALAGLQRKLTDAESELILLKEKKPTVIEGFLKSEAERLATSYVETAVNLARQLERIVAIGSMIKSYGGNIFNNYSSQTLTVPLFSLAACLDNTHPAYRGQLKAVVEVGPHQNLTPIIQAETERFKTQGVTL